MICIGMAVPPFHGAVESRGVYAALAVTESPKTSPKETATVSARSVSGGGLVSVPMEQTGESSPQPRTAARWTGLGLTLIEKPCQQTPRVTASPIEAI